MSAAGSADLRAREIDTEERRVTPPELFFDLVFVFAMTQVTGLLSDEPTPWGCCAGWRCSRRCGGPGVLLVAHQHRVQVGDGGRAEATLQRLARQISEDAEGEQRLARTCGGADIHAGCARMLWSSTGT